MNAGLYVRVSTLNQVDRDSLETQESRLRAYCKANEYNAYKVYKDAGLSAKDTKRPALEEMLRDIREGRVDAVLVTKLDRITRSTRDFQSLIEFFNEHNARFVSISENIDTSGAVGRFLRKFLALIAELERGITAERVSEDMYHRAGLGKWNGGVLPYGYLSHQRVMKQLLRQGVVENEALRMASEQAPEQKRLYLDPEESEVVRHMFESYLRTRSLRKVTVELNSQGYRTRGGATWAASSVRRILTNPTYTGKIWYGKRTTDPETGVLRKQGVEKWRIAEGQHEPIIPEETFDEVQKIISQRFKKPTRAFRTYLLASILRCGKCGGPMHGYTFKKKPSERIYVYYKCHHHASKGTCDGLTIPAKQLEDFVVKTLMELSEDRVFLGDKEKMLKILEEECKPAKTSERLKRLEARQSELQGMLDTLLEKLAKRLITEEDFKRLYDKTKHEMEGIEGARLDLRDESGQTEAMREALTASFEEIASFGRNWEFLDDKGKAAKIQTMVKEIRVTRDKIDMDIYLDSVEDVDRKVRDSWRLSA